MKILPDENRAYHGEIFRFNVSYLNLSVAAFLNISLRHDKGNLLYVNESKNILVFSYGNIFNRSDLCSDLGIEDGTPLPELISELYLIKGTDFVNLLNGDFLIIIYRIGEDCISLFRDHLGVCPVAYHTIGDTLFFSTDIISLCKKIHDGGRINMEPLMAEFRYADLIQTPNEKVFKLLPGHFMTFGPGGFEITKYWHPEKIRIDRSLTLEKATSDLKSILLDSVRIRSDSIMNAAAHVSGGLDSSLVAALARKEYRNQDVFYGYSWSPSNFNNVNVEWDERTVVRETCRLNNISPVFVDLRSDDYLALSKRYIVNFGFFAEEKILDQARDHGTDIIFSGFGGDEFLSFGGRGVDTDLVLNLNWRLFLRRNSCLKPRKILQVLLEEIILPALNIPDRRSVRAHREFTRYLKKPYSKNNRKAQASFSFYRSRRQLQLGLLNHYHIQDRIEKWAVSGFLRGVQYRYPLLDKRIIEYMLKVPSKVLLDRKHSRMILREIARAFVPEEVRWVKKGIDPVIVAQARKNCTHVAESFLSEMEEIKANPDMDFVNFEAIAEDAVKFRENPENKDVFISNLLVIKELHEFSRSYRSS